MRKFYWILLVLLCQAAFGETINVDGGIGKYTGGLGSTNDTGFSFGVTLLVPVPVTDLEIEAGVHRTSTNDNIQVNATQSINIDTELNTFCVGARYHFGLPFLDPYLVGGAGFYQRKQDAAALGGLTVDKAQSKEAPLGFYGGLGADTNFGLLHLGADVRYHFIPFSDEDDTLGLPANSGVNRHGDFVSLMFSVGFRFY